MSCGPDQTDLWINAQLLYVALPLCIGLQPTENRRFSLLQSMKGKAWTSLLCTKLWVVLPLLGISTESDIVFLMNTIKSLNSNWYFFFFFFFLSLTELIWTFSGGMPSCGAVMVLLVAGHYRCERNTHWHVIVMWLVILCGPTQARYQLSTLGFFFLLVSAVCFVPFYSNSFFSKSSLEHMGLPGAALENYYY